MQLFGQVGLLHIRSNPCGTSTIYFWVSLLSVHRMAGNVYRIVGIGRQGVFRIIVLFSLNKLCHPPPGLSVSP
jgi:hypothetical protein